MRGVVLELAFGKGWEDTGRKDKCWRKHRAMELALVLGHPSRKLPSTEGHRGKQELIWAPASPLQHWP